MSTDRSFVSPFMTVNYSHDTKVFLLAERLFLKSLFLRYLSGVESFGRIIRRNGPFFNVAMVFAGFFRTGVSILNSLLFFQTEQSSGTATQSSFRSIDRDESKRRSMEISGLIVPATWVDLGSSGAVCWVA